MSDNWDLGNESNHFILTASEKLFKEMKDLNSVEFPSVFSYNQLIGVHKQLGMILSYILSITYIIVGKHCRKKSYITRQIKKLHGIFRNSSNFYHFCRIC